MSAPTIPTSAPFPHASAGPGFPGNHVDVMQTSATGSFDTQSIDAKTFVCVPYESAYEKYFMEGSLLFVNHNATEERILRRMTAIGDLCMLNHLLRSRQGTLAMFRDNRGVAATNAEARENDECTQMNDIMAQRPDVRAWQVRAQLAQNEAKDKDAVISATDNRVIHWTRADLPPSVACKLGELLKWSFLGIQNKSMSGTGVSSTTRMGATPTDTVDTCVGVDVMGCTKVKNIWGHLRYGDKLHLGLRMADNTVARSFKGDSIVPDMDMGRVPQIFGYTDQDQIDYPYLPLAQVGVVRYTTRSAPAEATIRQALYSTNEYRRLPWIHVCIRM